MKKGVLILVLLALLIVPVLSLSITSAQTPVTTNNGVTPNPNAGFSLSFSSIDTWSQQCRQALSISTGAKASDITQNQQLGFFQKRLCLWLGGAPSIEDPNNRWLVGETLKYLVLLMVIFLVYSVLKQVNFPEGTTPRVVLAIIVGFLATFMITTDELITSLTSYTALGITFTIFFPIFILGALTLFVATKASPIGIFFQKIAWLIYSLYLFIKAGLLLLAKHYYVNGSYALPAVVQDGKTVLSGTGESLQALFQNFGLLGANGVPAAVSGSDTTITIILFIVAIAVFIIGVKGNDMVITWLEKEKLQSAVEARKNQMELAKADEKLKAEDMMKR